MYYNHVHPYTYACAKTLLETEENAKCPKKRMHVIIRRNLVSSALVEKAPKGL